MSTSVEQFVVHRILLSDDGKLHFLPRGSVFDINEHISNLAEQLHSTFNAKPGKGVGGFVEENPDFNDLLKSCIAETVDFHEFSLQAGSRLLESIVNEGMVETGYVIFSQYEYLATRYLLIAMLDTKDHVEVNQHLEISQSQHLDLSKMQIAIRIDLTDFEIQPELNRYISFLKGRMGRKVSDFFMQFVGCEELVDIKQQNKRLVQQVDEFLAVEQVDPNEKHQHREAVAQYYKQKIDLGEDIYIAELDDVLPKNDTTEASFSSYNAKQAEPLEKSFQADRSMLTAMKKFSGAGAGVNISFDRKLLGDRVHFDVVNDRITIQGIPPNLKDQLLKAEQQAQENNE
ncbi:nucleoid-associated protein YejK [Agaribacter marinus]|uniref:Nucleoid-associated protein n=1 Tax=Agaribacter marinus TaxID=1431249 RepID=A0AA37SY18_9ALTE|nr:nucleoid-associated protein YejK [Agaribacter marinus]GLR70344.1 nucleoid-associated protein [Agaribacter marinus]